MGLGSGKISSIQGGIKVEKVEEVRVEFSSFLILSDSIFSTEEHACV
jgi:hypothetical protein